MNAYLGLGDNEQAFAALEQAYKEKSAILQWVKIHPYFDPIRSDPRFRTRPARRFGITQLGCLATHPLKPTAACMGTRVSGRQMGAPSSPAAGLEGVGG